MSALFIITVALLAAIAYTIYRKQQQHAGADFELTPSRPRGLFEESAGGERPSAARFSGDEEALKSADARAGLLVRAGQGDCGALVDAAEVHGGMFYTDILAELLRWTESAPARVRALAGIVAEDERLRGSVELSRAYSLLWEKSPDRASTARAFHLAALSDNAAEFGRVVGVAARLLRDGRLSGVAAGELCSLAESEFWVLAATARASGAGFVVKQMIASLREEARGSM